MKTLSIVDAPVKLCGRTVAHKGVLYTALSATGIEFDFTGKSLVIEVVGDDNNSKKSSERIKVDDKADDGYPRLGIFVGEDCIFADLITEPKKDITIIDSDDVTSVRVRVIKLSEAPHSILGLASLIMDDEATVKAVPECAKKIEIIGDSITCGYGVEGKRCDEPFSTATENVSKAHSYMAAKGLDLDYSLVSYSGYGIVSGYTEEEEPRLDLILPDYYDLVAHSFGTVDGERVTETEWDFNKFTPDVTVINLGTNDESWCKDNEDRRSQYVTKYIEFVKHVREKAPKSHIILAYGIMTDMFWPLVEKVAADYKANTGDDNLSTFRYTTHCEDDGFGCDWHPSAYSQKRACIEITEEIKKYL